VKNGRGHTHTLPSKTPWVGFLQHYLLTTKGSALIPSRAANTLFSEIKFSLRDESAHLTQPQPQTGRHTSLNQILCIVHLQPRGRIKQCE
jgi:hypothetical protein